MIAIGALVDDAVIDVENVFRRLKENRLKPNPEPPLEVIYHASFTDEETLDMLELLMDAVRRLDRAVGGA